MKEETGNSDDWILVYVVPHNMMWFSDSVALFLGTRALCWVTFEEFGVYLLQAVVHRIKMVYMDIRVNVGGK